MGLFSQGESRWKRLVAGGKIGEMNFLLIQTSNKNMKIFKAETHVFFGKCVVW